MILLSACLGGDDLTDLHQCEDDDFYDYIEQQTYLEAGCTFEQCNVCPEDSACFEGIVQGTYGDGGRVVICGQYTDNGDALINPHRLINKKHLQIRGSWGSDFSHFHRALAVMARHHERFPWREMISARYGLSQLNEALHAVETQAVVKAAVDPYLPLAFPAAAQNPTETPTRSLLAG